MLFLRQKLLIGAILVVLFGTSLIFRENISRLFYFGEEEQIMESPQEQGEAAPLPTDNSSENTGSAGSAVGASDTPQFFTSSGALLPPYKGRPPGEIRSVPEEVKLFTEEQKKQIFDQISTEAQAVKLDPIHFQGWINLGLLKKTIGDFEGARDVWEYASLIEPLNSLSFSNLGELYWRYLHEYQKSEANLRASIEHKPDDIQNYVSLAELYHYSYKEKYELADDVLLDGLKANLDNGTLMRRLAYLYEQRKEWDKALEWWEKVLNLSPDDEEVKRSIEKVKARMGGGN